MAVKVYSLNARIPVKIGDVTFKLSPFSQSQKIEMAEFANFESGQYLQNASRMTFRALKYSIKGVEGLEDALTGEPYALEFDDSGCLTDAAVNDLLSIEIADKLMIACMAILKGIPKEIVNPQTGQKMEGVEVLPVESALKKNTPAPTP